MRAPPCWCGLPLPRPALLFADCAVRVRRSAWGRLAVCGSGERPSRSSGGRRQAVGKGFCPTCGAIREMNGRSRTLDRGFFSQLLKVLMHLSEETGARRPIHPEPPAPCNLIRGHESLRFPRGPSMSAKAGPCHFIHSSFPIPIYFSRTLISSCFSLGRFRSSDSGPPGVREEQQIGGVVIRSPGRGGVGVDVQFCPRFCWLISSRCGFTDEATGHGTSCMSRGEVTRATRRRLHN